MESRAVRMLTGIVAKNSGNKSISVTIDYKVKHPKYGKYVRRRTKVAVHDEQNLGAVGDLVSIAECRPYSKRKSWRLVRVLQKAIQA